MSRKDKRGKKVKNRKPAIQPETKKSVFAILLIGLGAVLSLAVLGQAGPVGGFLFNFLNSLFGWGYYLFPVLAFAVAALLLLARRRVALGVTFIGAAMLILSGLGLIDVLFPMQGGLVGRVVGIIEALFGYIASIVLLIVGLVIGLLVTFDTSIRIGKRSEPEPEEEKKEVALDSAEAVIVEPARAPVGKKNIAEAAAPPALPEEDPADKDESSLGGVAAAKKKGTVPRAAPEDILYNPPPATLLKSTIDKPTAGDLRGNANIIKRTLDSFGIPVEMGEISIGPKVTRYTLKPAEGIKLSRITALHQDLALALAAHPIRIEAPIPGKSLVGIEVPNKTAALVRLGSLMAYPEFNNSNPLAMILGRDVTGEPILSDIEKMPHLLVAGATGSGKSIFLHTLIVSLLYKNSPAALRLILVDPKRVELSVYKDIPHLITPVITEGKKTIGVFRWAINEMERRYEILLGAGARDINAYNQKFSGKKNGEEGGYPLPYLVIVIDELADLMAAFGREIESSIVRLAQMARATGIHLVVSTQRPSVEVITGLIKANITARVALQVASQVDSRTILDMAGAEKLLGGGDMLFISSDFSKPKRIQAAYVSDEEIAKVAEYIRTHNQGYRNYEENLVLPDSPVAFGQYADEGDGEDDELYNEAVEAVRSAGKASASLLQRRLKVGYARAARLLDIMEARGIIGPGEGAKPREIFLDSDGASDRAPDDES